MISVQRQSSLFLPCSTEECRLRVGNLNGSYSQTHAGVKAVFTGDSRTNGKTCTFLEEEIETRETQSHSALERFFNLFVSFSLSVTDIRFLSTLFSPSLCLSLVFCICLYVYLPLSFSLCIYLSF